MGRADETRQIHEFIGNKIIDDAVAQARKARIGEVKGVVAEGDPASCILDTADSEQVDMIVLGSRGLGTLKGLLLGSVSQKVSHMAKCTTVCAR